MRGNSIWTINVNDVFRFRTPDGDSFTEFVDALIRAEAFSAGISDSEILTNVRTTKPDGGVDTEVKKKLPLNYLKSGWFTEPTCWQYKATDAGKISEKDLSNEIEKRYVTELIKRGYAYRYCICDDIPPEKKSHWESVLKKGVEKINPSSADPKVVTASDLAAWVNRFPPIILRFFKPGLGVGVHFSGWGKNITSYTPKYIEVESWKHIKWKISKHIDFTKSVEEVGLRIIGKRGIGKTRLVYESLKEFGADGLVIYVDDEKNAKEIILHLVNHPSAKAILVIDDCFCDSGYWLNNHLHGYRERVRVILISSDKSASRDQEIEKISDKTLKEIIKQNFPNVLYDRRYKYVKLAEGFVQLAICLCKLDDQNTNFISHLDSVNDYLCALFNEKQLKALEIIALFGKITFEENVSYQLEQVSDLLKYQKSEIQDTAIELKDNTGFVVKRGRFFTITPEIVADFAFKRAAERLLNLYPDNLISQIPEEYLCSFLKRLSRTRNNLEELCKEVSNHYIEWFGNLAPNDLRETKKIKLLELLVEIDPGTYLELLKNLIDNTSIESLRNISGEWEGGWGPRRTLVWLTERMAAFPEYFTDAESILWRLALAESEPQIGNNATAIWEQLFGISLSGTAIPFSERIELLQKRAFSQGDNEKLLAVKVLDNILSNGRIKILGKAVIAGRVPPQEWFPKTNIEQQECLKKILNLLSKLRVSGNVILETRALDVIISELRILLIRGWLIECQKFISLNKVPDDKLPEFIQSIENFFKYDAIGMNDQEYVDEVKAWLQDFKDIEDFHKRLIITVGKEKWHHYEFDKEQWNEEIENLAKMLGENTDLLLAEIGWLCSDKAKSADKLGKKLGERDERAHLSDIVIKAAIDNKSTIFANGYLYGLRRKFPEHETLINLKIDQIMPQFPIVGHYLSLGGADKRIALERSLASIDSGTLSPKHLINFTYGNSAEWLTSDLFLDILKRFVGPLKEKDKKTTKVAIDAISYLLHGNRSIISTSKIQSLIWDILEASIECSEIFAWTEVLKVISRYDPERALKITCYALVNLNIFHKRSINELFLKLANDYPESAMNILGEKILDNQSAWKFYIGNFKLLLQSLPVETIKNWLISKGGLEGARRIARHLPLPHLDKNGFPVVPPITEFVLSEFEDDDKTFNEFSCGIHCLQVYSGDIAAQREEEAIVAQKFLTHKLSRIKQWAQEEVKSSRQEAQHWREEEEEFGLD